MNNMLAGYGIQTQAIHMDACSHTHTHGAQYMFKYNPYALN